MWAAVNCEHVCTLAFIDHLLCAHHYWQSFDIVNLKRNYFKITYKSEP